jgi:hypothetical protein
MTRTVADAAVMFQAMGGCVSAPVRPAEGRRVFGARALYCARLEPGVRATLERTRRELRRRTPDRRRRVAHAEWTADVYLHMLPRRRRHARLTPVEKCSPGVRLRLEMGRYVLAEDFVAR